jgi:phenylalanyl-tRNA synthetase alpha chain
MRDLLAALSELRERLQEIPQADPQRLAALKTELLGRKGGALTKILAQLPTLDPAAKKAVGAQANAVKREVEAALELRERELKRAGAESAGLDLTMPAREQWQGGLHLVTQVVDEICAIFGELGFTRAVGPEIETERNNFYALNFPRDHPALDAQDSFYLTDALLLRTHTSPVQIRTLERYPPPIRVVIPGRAYRRDPFDASHAPVFEQIEGLAVDEGLSFVDFKATLSHFARRFFTPDTPVRFRPSFFPFTEPSAEMDVQCQICGGAGCATCKQTGWMEILGSGMVHPAVLEGVGVDAERYTGFAWGMGPERIAMTRHGIPDIRLFFESDMRFLAQFAAGAGGAGGAGGTR